MTIFVCDGTNILMDKVTLLEYKKGDFELKDPVSGPLGGHYENKGKIHLKDLDKGAKAWGRRIKLFTGIGNIDYHWFDIIQTDQTELQQIFIANKHWDFLSKEMRLIVLDEDDTVSQIFFDKLEHNWVATEVTQVHYKDRKKLTIEGYGSEELMSFQHTNNIMFTALEALVFSQTLTPKLGRRFDHYHIPTGKITLDNDLSDRQRDKVMDGIEKRMSLSRTYDSVYLLNTKDGK